MFDRKLNKTSESESAVEFEGGDKDDSKSSDSIKEDLQNEDEAND
jgi:hypothetical protein